MKIEFNFSFSIDKEGRGGGLAVLWRKSISCSIMSFSQNFINMYVEDPNKGP